MEKGRYKKYIWIIIAESVGMTILDVLFPVYPLRAIPSLMCVAMYITALLTLQKAKNDGVLSEHKRKICGVIFYILCGLIAAAFVLTIIMLLCGNADKIRFF